MSKKHAAKPASGYVWSSLMIGIGLLVLVAFSLVMLVYTLATEEAPLTNALTVAELGSEINAQEYEAVFLQGSQQHLLVDVRTPEEFAEGHIENALNIPLDTLSSQLDQLPQDTPIVLYCRSGNRSKQAYELMQATGYSQVYDLGGIIDWQASGFAVIR
jgi:phage shock protein E